ncbi:pyridoxamine 5'-phosphate oxidase family protein [Epibacterium ulvae]|uniref:MSMEG_1061 family FMN-dependent PPOX-type flavoprotein n=1 Tax=Epibacterium ulvae TaxID=1156985 RepID=UPI001BFC76DE|nr:MSMEG_1061 family FMN-dependent PPOX-type flavoprotein [Epibacterium ulvae]MBT8154868.1 pyridoxamine 5'-phosphate oxidase family protein [Epibacterium ulvae]
MTQVDYIETVEALEAFYEAPADLVINKVMAELSPLYEKWIMASRLCMVATVGPEGTDDSPRGDTGPVVQVLDSKTLALPDWPGNNRLDSLRNIIRDGRISLMFLVAGSDNVVRINGTARLTADPVLRARFDRNGKQPRTVILVSIHEVYGQCAQALKRAETWTAGDQSQDLPTVAELIGEALEWSAKNTA